MRKRRRSKYSNPSMETSILISKEFNSVKVNENLDKFENIVENGYLTTTFDGKQICKVEVSKVYYNFDFTNFSKSILSEIQKYFTPERYKLKVKSGVQEIRLTGDELYIDNERYEKIISIVNSTDKSKALSISVGLVRVEKDEYPQSYTILTNFANKHYKSSLPDKIKSFSDNLINFNMNIDFHVKTIGDLKNKNVSIVNFSKALLFNEEGKLIKTNELKLRALCKNLKYVHSIKKYNTLSNLTSDSINTVEDFKINSKILFTNYIEIFKEQDTSVIARESRRIIDILESL